MPYGETQTLDTENKMQTSGSLTIQQEVWEQTSMGVWRGTGFLIGLIISKEFLLRRNLG